MNGWIKLHRKITEKGYYRDSEYIHLWVHIILRANHKDNEWIYKGSLHKCKRGQFITSRKSLSQETGISESKVERILKTFKIEQQIEQQNLFSRRLITILRYNDYQDVEQENEQPVNSQRTASEQLVNTNKNEKNEKNDKKYNTYVDNSTELQLSKLFLKQIKNNNPKFKEPNLQKWSDDFNKMIRIDKRTQEEIEALIYWCQQDNFWKSNILSAKTLREKFDRLWIKAKSDIEKKRNETFDL